MDEDTCRWERRRVEHEIERRESMIEGFGVWGMGMKVRFEEERERVPRNKRGGGRRKHIDNVGCFCFTSLNE